MSVDWMSQLEGEQLTGGLFESSKIVFPGTHNSAVSSLCFDHNVYPPKSKWFWLHCFPARDKIRALTITQNTSITQQLEMGVRFFDLRVGLVDGDPWIFHTFCVMRLDTVIQQFCAFLRDKKYASSVLILHIKPDFESAPFTLPSQEHEAKIISLLKTLNFWLIKEVKDQSLGALQQSDTRLVIKYEHKFPPKQYDFTLYGGAPFEFNTNWPNTGDLNQLVELDENAVGAPKNAPLYGISFDLNLPTNVRGLWSANLRDMAARINATEFPRIIKDIRDRKLQGSVNLLSLDFINIDLVTSIVNLNFPDRL